jgi:hypothetical protein
MLPNPKNMGDIFIHPYLYIQAQTQLIVIKLPLCLGIYYVRLALQWEVDA